MPAKRGSTVKQYTCSTVQQETFEGENINMYMHRKYS